MPFILRSRQPLVIEALHASNVIVAEYYLMGGQGVWVEEVINDDSMHPIVPGGSMSSCLLE